jgi:hypothetical protein
MRATLGPVVAIGLMLGVACSDPSCTVTESVYTASGDAVPTGGSAVARVDAAQSFKKYGPAGCSGEPLQSVGVVSATITSTSAAPMRLTFSVQGLDANGNPAWNFPKGTGSQSDPNPSTYTVDPFAPGQSVDLGQVATTATTLTNLRVVVTEYAPAP